jgi:hypothetical protein
MTFQRPRRFAVVRTQREVVRGHRIVILLRLVGRPGKNKVPRQALIRDGLPDLHPFDVVISFINGAKDHFWEGCTYHSS